jgi:hypothetical protein
MSKKLLYGLSSLLIAAVLVAGCASTDGGGSAAAEAGVADETDPVMSALSEDQSANVTDAFFWSVDAAEDREFDPGRPAHGIRSWDGTEVIYQTYEGGDAPALFVMANADAWYAHLVQGPFAEAYLEGGPDEYGTPVTDEYPSDLGGLEQVFTKGIMVAEDGVFEFIPEPYEPAEVPLQIGEARPGDPVLSELDQATVDRIARAYREAWLVTAAKGIDPGVPFNGDQVHQWDGPIVQNLAEGDSRTNAWGIPAAALIFMYPEERYAYYVRDDFISKLTIGEGIGAHSGAFGYGGAISNEYLYEGLVAQAFGKGIMQKNEQGFVDFIPYE